VYHNLSFRISINLFNKNSFCKPVDQIKLRKYSIFVRMREIIWTAKSQGFSPMYFRMRFISIPGVLRELFVFGPFPIWSSSETEAERLKYLVYLGIACTGVNVNLNGLSKCRPNVLQIYRGVLNQRGSRVMFFLGRWGRRNSSGRDRAECTPVILAKHIRIFFFFVVRALNRYVFPNWTTGRDVPFLIFVSLYTFFGYRDFATRRDQFTS